MLTATLPYNHTTTQPMRETSQADLRSSLYGLLRLVAGYQDWRLIEDLPQDEWLPTLISHTMESINQLNADVLNADPKEQRQLLRKLGAYQQVATIENFCFKEVEWD